MAYDFSGFKEEAANYKEWLSREYTGINTGRATPAVLDLVSVENFGARMAVPHIASIIGEDQRTLRVSPWDKSNIKLIEKAINDANLGLSVSVDEAGLRVSFPQLTEERRHALVKVLKEKLEEARVKLRLLREDALKDLEVKEKEGGMGEDEKFRHKEELQKLVDEWNTALEETFRKKEKDVMGIL